MGHTVTELVEVTMPSPQYTPARRFSVRRSVLPALLAFAAVASTAQAQDLNITLPVAEIEARILERPFRVAQWSGSRMPEDRTQRALVIFDDSTTMWLKFAVAPSGGTGTFNNEPRYEAAAYELQKLFLDEPEFVVPPTLLRVFPIDWIRERSPNVRPTFRNAPGSVLFAVQYWLQGVTPENFWDPVRAREDTLYARHIGNFNILTHLIRHQDANAGNYLISQHRNNPRVFAVDNGVAFNSVPSDRGVEWRDLRVDRLPRHTIERLRAVTPELLAQRLGVLAEYEIRDGQLVAVTPTANFGDSRGVRQRDGRIQIGLTRREIQQVERRIRDLVKKVDEGKLRVF